MAKSDRRARKRANRALRPVPSRIYPAPLCEQCGFPDLGNDGWSAGHVTWDGVAVVAWCKRCGWEIAA